MSDIATKQHQLFREKLADEHQVATEIDVLAGELIAEFKGTNPLFVCLLRGGMPFATQLMFAITKRDPYFNPELDYMTVSRYGSTLTPIAVPKVVMDLSYKTTIINRPVIVLDDIIDKGETYAFTKKHLESKGAEKVYMAALVRRELAEPREFDTDYYCFNVTSQEWLTGMGLDDPRLGKEANRWAQYVAIANSGDS